KVEIVTVSDDERWYEVETSDGRTGWLYAVYVNTGAATESEAATSAAPTAAPTATAEPSPVATPAVIVLPDGVPGATTVPARMNVRGGPGTNYPVVASVAAGTTFEIVGLNPGSTWYQVRVPDREEPAWVFANLTVLSGSLEGVPQ